MDGFLGTLTRSCSISLESILTQSSPVHAVGRTWITDSLLVTGTGLVKTREVKRCYGGGDGEQFRDVFIPIALITHIPPLRLLGAGTRQTWHGRMPNVLCPGHGEHVASFAATYPVPVTNFGHLARHETDSKSGRGVFCRNAWPGLPLTRMCMCRSLKSASVIGFFG